MHLGYQMITATIATINAFRHPSNCLALDGGLGTVGTVGAGAEVGGGVGGDMMPDRIGGSTGATVPLD